MDAYPFDLVVVLPVNAWREGTYSTLKGLLLKCLLGTDN